MNANTSQPNSTLFPDSADSLQVRDGRKAFRDEDGIWRNAIGLESTEMHRHVSRIWQNKCIPFEAFIEQVNEDEKTKRDSIVEARELRVDDNLDLANFEGSTVPLTRPALCQLASLAKVPRAVITFGIEEENEFFRPWASETLNRKLAMELNSDAPHLLRFRKDDKGRGILRGIFGSSQLYGHLDNSEMLNMLGDCFPKSGWKDALASHLYDDRDTIKGNVLFPDYMKSLPDSDYGVGVAFTNSEVGGGLSIAPFLFRAICLNGCIWSRRDSVVKISRSSSDDIDREQLKTAIKRAVDLALTEGNDLLVQMGYVYDVPVKNVGGAIAHIVREFGLTQEQGRNWYNGYISETVLGSSPRNTAFAVIQGLTRSAQSYKNPDLRALVERKASEILTPSLKASLENVQDRWREFAEAGELIEEKKVHQIIMMSAAGHDRN